MKRIEPTHRLNVDVERERRNPRQRDPNLDFLPRHNPAQPRTIRASPGNVLGRFKEFGSPLVSFLRLLTSNCSARRDHGELTYLTPSCPSCSRRGREGKEGGTEEGNTSRLGEVRQVQVSVCVEGLDVSHACFTLAEATRTEGLTGNLRIEQQNCHWIQGSVMVAATGTRGPNGRILRIAIVGSCIQGAVGRFISPSRILARTGLRLRPPSCPSSPGKPSLSYVSKFTTEILELTAFLHSCAHSCRHGLLLSPRCSCHSPLSSEKVAPPWDRSRRDIRSTRTSSKICTSKYSSSRSTTSRVFTGVLDSCPPSHLCNDTTELVYDIM